MYIRTYTYTVTNVYDDVTYVYDDVTNTSTRTNTHYTFLQCPMCMMM